MLDDIRKYRKIGPEKLTYNEPANISENILSNIILDRKRLI